MHTLRERLTYAELHLTVLCNLSCRRSPVARLFGFVSRIGNGVVWYVLMALLPILYGSQGLWVSIQMLTAGLVSLRCYRWLKTKTKRLRPRDTDRRILRTTAPLDQFSFPSGHTLHAVAFTTIAVNAFPALGPALISLTLMIAASRVALGLHYPSDVAAGALVGFLTAHSVLFAAGLLPAP